MFLSLPFFLSSIGTALPVNRIDEASSQTQAGNLIVHPLVSFQAVNPYPLLPLAAGTSKGLRFGQHSSAAEISPRRSTRTAPCISSAH